MTPITINISDNVRIEISINKDERVVISRQHQIRSAWWSSGQILYIPIKEWDEFVKTINRIDGLMVLK